MYSMLVCVFLPRSDSLRIVSSDSAIRSSFFSLRTESEFFDSDIFFCRTFFLTSDTRCRFSFSLYRYYSHFAHIDEHIRDFSRRLLNESFTSSLNSRIYDASYSFVTISDFLGVEFSFTSFILKLFSFRIF